MRFRTIAIGILTLSCSVNVFAASSTLEVDRAVIIDLGVLNGGRNSSYASAISADGNVVVGTANDGHYSQAAFRWTLQTGMNSLDHSLLFRPYAFATAVNSDGSVIVGTIGTTAFRWTKKKGIVRLGTLAGTEHSDASAVSADGNVVVGNSGFYAYRWTESTGMVALPHVGNTKYGAQPTAVSSDGRLIFGSDFPHGSGLVRWDDSGNITRFPNPKGVTNSEVSAMTPDGLIAAGAVFDEIPRMRATLWFSPTKLLDLGLLHGGSNSKATAISADGMVVVGFAGDGANADRMTAFRWTQATGMQSISEWVEKAGGKAPLSNPSRASGVNADGSRVVGTLENGNPFVAIVPIPVDASIVGRH